MIYIVEMDVQADSKDLAAQIPVGNAASIIFLSHRSALIFISFQPITFWCIFAALLWKQKLAIHLE